MIHATLKYHLRNVQDKTYVYLSISNGANNRFRIFPNIRLNDKSNWNKEKEKIKVTPAEPNAKSLNDKLYEFKTHFIEELKECYKNDIRLDKDVIKRIEKTFGNSVTNKKIKLTNDKFDLTIIWSEFVEGMESGLYKHKSKGSKVPYSNNTIQNHKGSIKRWAEFEKKHGKILPHQINESLHSQFVHFYENHENSYLNNAINKWIVCFKALVNKEPMKPYKKQMLEYDSREWTEVSNETLSWALTEDELDTLYNLDLSDNPEYDLYRDVFVFNAHTCGMRIGDYLELNDKEIKTVEDKAGNSFDVLEFNQQKTGGRVVVPIPNVGLNIIKKHGGIPMPESSQRSNEVLKILGKKAKLYKKISKKLTNGKILEARQWEILTNHVARKTFCTLTYKSGVNTLDIMNISGHKSEKVLLGYINVTEEQHALRWTQTDYFKKVNRKHLRIA
jgi:site-specific recombinase XerD